VPLLQVDGEVLFESAAIVEYLEDTRAPSLHPADPLQRARHRAWMEFGSSILADIWTIETTPDRAVFEVRRQLLREKFTRLQAELGEGPYFAGRDFRLVDAVFAPVFRYFDVFDRFVELGVFTGLQKVQAWRRARRSGRTRRSSGIPGRTPRRRDGSRGRRCRARSCPTTKRGWKPSCGGSNPACRR
jgi:glutathione S-transferase